MLVDAPLFVCPSTSSVYRMSRVSPSLSHLTLVLIANWTSLSYTSLELFGRVPRKISKTLPPQMSEIIASVKTKQFFIN